MITTFAANGAVCSALIGFIPLFLSFSSTHSVIHSLCHTLPLPLTLSLSLVLLLVSPFTLETTFPILPPSEKKLDKT